MDGFNIAVWKTCKITCNEAFFNWTLFWTEKHLMELSSSYDFWFMLNSVLLNGFLVKRKYWKIKILVYKDYINCYLNKQSMSSVSLKSYGGLLKPMTLAKYVHIKHVYIYFRVFEPFDNKI